MVACDIYRPAAIEQLQINGEKQGVEVFSMGINHKPVDIAKVMLMCLIHDIVEIDAGDTFAYDEWKEACRRAETAYFNLLNWGLSPQEARAVLPNSLKTEVVMTANIREWRHFLRLRTSTGAHTQIREIATPLLRELQQIVPVCFDDILPKEGEQ